MRFTDILNVLGVALLVIESFNLRPYAERALDRFIAWYAPSGMVKQYMKGIGEALLVSIGAAVIFVAWTGLGWAMPDWLGAILVLCIVAGILNPLILTFHILFNLFLRSLRAFPRGSLAALGAVIALSSIALDYV